MKEINAPVLVYNFMIILNHENVDKILASGVARVLSAIDGGT